MPAQNNAGRQFDKQHAITVVATAAISAYRFVGYDGAHATSAGGAHDSQGVSEHAGMVGNAVSVVTGYSYLVEVGAGANIAFGDFVKPDATGGGTAISGDVDDHCGRALGAGGAGALIEVQILPHVLPAA